jgi:hypothetical protein
VAFQNRHLGLKLASQILTVPSRLQEARRLPSALNATWLTRLAWPRRNNNSRRESTSQVFSSGFRVQGDLETGPLRRVADGPGRIDGTCRCSLQGQLDFRAPARHPRFEEQHRLLQVPPGDVRPD